MDAGTKGIPMNSSRDPRPAWNETANEIPGCDGQDRFSRPCSAETRPHRGAIKSEQEHSSTSLVPATNLERLQRLVDEQNFTLCTWREKDGSLWASVMPGEGHAHTARSYRTLLPARTRFGPLAEWMPIATGARLSEVLAKLEATLERIDPDWLKRDSEWTRAVIDAVRIAMNVNHDQSLRVVGKPRR